MNVKHIVLIIGTLVVPHTTISQSINDKILKLKVDFESFENVKMSEVFSDIRYLPLETNPNCLIGYMNIPVFGKEILINSNDESFPIYRFTREGRFINKVGQKGRGPGEYEDRCDVQLFGDTVYVVSNFSRDIFLYSLKGAFIKKYHLNIEARPKSIIQLKDKSFFISFSNLSKLGMIAKTDRNFNIKSGFIKHAPFDNNPMPFRFQRSGDQVFYYYNYMDTIFDLSKGYPSPAIVIDYGKYRISKEKRSIYEEDNVILNSPYLIDFCANNEYMMFRISYPFKGETYVVLHKISDGTQTRWDILKNDIDCGIIDSYVSYVAESSLIFILKPTKILERFSGMTNAEKADPKNTRFVSMASKILPESNPVLMICKLK